MTREEFAAWALMAGAKRSDTGVSMWLEWDTPKGHIMVRFEHKSPVCIQVFVVDNDPPKEFSSMISAVRHLSELVHA